MRSDATMADPMYRLLLTCITVSVLSAPAVAADQKPSNFRRTSIATGGTLGLDFSHIFEQKLDDTMLDAPLGGVARTAPDRRMRLAGRLRARQVLQEAADESQPDDGRRRLHW